MSFARLILLLEALSVSACMTSVAPGTRPIILDASYTRNTLEAGSVVFPKGVYQPTFQTKRGVYYEAPTVLISAGNPVRGGLIIPDDPSAKAVRDRFAENRKWGIKPHQVEPAGLLSRGIVRND